MADTPNTQRIRYEAARLLDRLRHDELVLGVPELYDRAVLTVDSVKQTLVPFRAAEEDAAATRTLREALEAFVSDTKTTRADLCRCGHERAWHSHRPSDTIGEPTGPCAACSSQCEDGYQLCQQDRPMSAMLGAAPAGGRGATGNSGTGGGAPPVPEPRQELVGVPSSIWERIPPALRSARLHFLGSGDSLGLALAKAVDDLLTELKAAKLSGDLIEPGDSIAGVADV